MKNVYKYTLEEDFHYYDERLKGYTSYTPFGFVNNGIITIRKGYSWDGCTPKFKLFGKIVGTPDFNGKTKWASLVHDFLYQFKIGTREIADNIFYSIMNAHRFIFAGLYYNVVNKFGKYFW